MEEYKIIYTLDGNANTIFAYGNEDLGNTIEKLLNDNAIIIGIIK